MTPDPLALVAAMPLPQPLSFFVPEPGKAQFTADQLRSERLKAAQLVLTQGEPAAPALSPYDAVARALELASLMGGSIGMSNVEQTEAYKQRLRAHLIARMYPPAAPVSPVNAEMLAALKKIASETAATWVSDVANAAIASAEAAAKGAA